MTTSVRIALSATAVLLLAGCQSSASTSTSGESSASPPQGASPRLVAAAGLAPCPKPGVVAANPSLPDLTLPCLGEGPPVNLSRLTGAPTVVNVWGSWCAPCRKELPTLASVSAAAGPKVRFLGVDYEDDPDAALELLAAAGVRYPSVRDDDGLLKSGIRIVGLPLTVFVRGDGSVAYEWRAPITSEQQLRELIQEHLGVTV